MLRPPSFNLRPGLRRLLAAWVVLGLVLPAGAAVSAALTSIREIRALPPAKAAEGLPATVRGIITRLTPYELFIQNGPDAIFVWQNSAGTAGLRMGDEVEVRGITHDGHLFPVIKEPVITVLGHPGLPVPQVVRYADLATAKSDCQWVEVSGVVRAIEGKSADGLSLQVFFDGHLLRADIHEPPAQEIARLLGARVRFRGVISGLKTLQRKILEPVLWLAYRPDTFVIETPGPEDIFAAPLWPMDVLQDRGEILPPGGMARVGGIVTSQPSPHSVFLRDGTRNMEIRLQQPARLAGGDRIEAVGFPEMGLVQPMLQSALVRRLSAGRPPPPNRLRAADLLDFRHEAELVEVEGELLEVFRHNDGLTLLLADAGNAFNVDIGSAQLPAEVALPPTGSRLSLVGICQIDRVTPPNLAQIVSAASARLRLRSFDDLRVLSRPPWWTPQRLLAAVALLSVFALGALGWIWTLNRRVQAQTRIILGSAQKEAVLEERNRIAREFHDTLEQELAGATILLDAVDAVVLEQPQRARAGLGTARAMLRHSLDEAQQAVADLRNNDLIERELGPLIEEAVQERLHATGIKADFQRDGVWPELDTMVKQHLLRIVQEAVTNAIKHAAPSHITVGMAAAPDRVELTVTDDGCGFGVPERVRGGAGQFGLLGLQERAGKIGARLDLRSAPGEGTTVTVRLPRPAPDAI